MSPRRKKRHDDEYYEDDRYDESSDSEEDDGYSYGDDEDDDRYDYDDYDDMVEDDYGINLQSKKKAGRYRIISLLFLLLVIGCSALLFVYKQKVANEHQTNCWTYQVTVENQIQKFVRTNGLSANPAYVDDVPGISGIKFVCPDGGSFTWNPVDGEFYCSEHGHYPDSFVTPESEVTGTTVTEVKDDK